MVLKSLVPLLCLLLVSMVASQSVHTFVSQSIKVFGGVGTENSFYAPGLLPLLISDPSQQYYYSCIDSNSPPFQFSYLYINSTSRYQSPVVLKWNRNTLQLIWAQVLDEKVGAFCLGLNLHSNLLHVNIYRINPSNFALLALNPETGARATNVAPRYVFPSTLVKFPTITYNNTNMLAVAGKTHVSDSIGVCSNSNYTFGLYVALVNAQSYEVVKSICLASGSMDQEMSQIEQDSQGNLYVLGFATDASILLVNTGQIISISNTTGQASAFVMKFSSNLELLGVQSMRSTASSINPLSMKMYKNKLYALVRFSDQLQVQRFFIRSALTVISNQALVRFDASTLQVEWFQELAPSKIVLCKSIVVDERDGHLILAMDVQHYDSFNLMNQLPSSGLEIGSVLIVKIHSTSASLLWYSILPPQNRLALNIHSMVMDNSVGQLVVSGALNSDDYFIMSISPVLSVPSQDTAALLPPIGYSLLSVNLLSVSNEQLQQDGEEISIQFTNSSVIETANTDNENSLVPLEISFQNLQKESMSQVSFGSASYAVYSSSNDQSIVGQVIGNGFGITVNRLRSSVSSISNTYVCIQMDTSSQTTNQNFAKPMFATKRVSKNGFEAVSNSVDVIQTNQKICGKISLDKNIMVFPALVEGTAPSNPLPSSNGSKMIILSWTFVACFLAVFS